MNASALLESLQRRFPSAVVSTHAYRGDATLVLAREHLLEVARVLEGESEFSMNFLMDLTAVDYSAFGKDRKRGFFASSGVAVRPSAVIPDLEPWPGPPNARLAVVYHFFSRTHGHRLRLVVPVEEEHPSVDSLVPLWPGANWLEREVWDMFGIRFDGHPDLRRILMYEGFEGHPLRKDYPVAKRQPLIGPLN